MPNAAPWLAHFEWAPSDVSLFTRLPSSATKRPAAGKWSGVGRLKYRFCRVIYRPLSELQLQKCRLERKTRKRKVTHWCRISQWLRWMRIKLAISLNYWSQGRDTRATWRVEKFCTLQFNGSSFKLTETWNWLGLDINDARLSAISSTLRSVLQALADFAEIVKVAKNNYYY